MLIFLTYFFFLASFLTVVAVIRKGPKVGLYTVSFIYLAIGSWATVLWIGEYLNPSIDANIGLGLSLLLMELLSIAGFILAIIITAAMFMINRHKAS